MDNRIFALADELKSARDRKKELEAQVKALSAQVEQLDQELSEAMTEAECDKFSHGGTTFYLKSRLFASPKAGRKVEMMQALKENGYGELVTETVNANTLSSFLGELEKEIICVLLYSHPANSYYVQAYQGGSNPPDCGSFDGVTGIGSPGGSCRACPYNQFGSGGGKAKACKNRRMLYLLRENEVFPYILNLPTGSLKGFTKYVQSLLARGRRPHQVVTKISLRKAASSSGIDFSQAVFKVVRVLDTEEQKNIDAFAAQMRGYAASLTMASMAEEAAFADAETGEVIEPLK